MDLTYSKHEGTWHIYKITHGAYVAGMKVMPADIAGVKAKK